MYAIAVAALAAWVSPAAAGDAPAAPSRAERIAAELAGSPLYADHGTASAWSTARGDEVRERLERAPLADLPVYVVSYTPAATDETGGDPALFLAALYEVSGRDGVYVAAVPGGEMTVSSFDAPVRPPEFGLDDLPVADGPPGRVDVLLDLVEAARVEAAPVTATFATDPEPLPPGSRAAPVEFTERSVPESRVHGPYIVMGFLFGFLAALAAGAFLVKAVFPHVAMPVAGWAASVLNTRFRRGGASARRRSHWAPDRPRRWLVRPVLRNELRVLHRLIERAPYGHPGLGPAREAYDAAGLIARSTGLPVTALVCAIVVARQGEQLIERPDLPPAPPCEANPLHGAATERRAMYTAGHRRVWGLCARCDAAAGPRVPYYMLVDTADGGRTYFRLADDPWVAIAYRPEGAFSRVRSALNLR